MTDRTLLPLLDPRHGLGRRLSGSPERALVPARRREVTVGAVVESVVSAPDYADEIVHVQYLPAREAAYRDPSPPLDPWLEATLGALGIERLYTHQAEAIEHLRAREHVTIVSGTASGKSLCYLVPALERLAADPQATALFLYPTKALAQDQARALTRAIGAASDAGAFHGAPPMCGTYDGDSPSGARRALRDGARVILSNPDMLHAAILPAHPRWARFLSGLSLVVVDEIHAYRGIFGSHVANVLRRLRRLAAHYGADPRFVMCSATIRNPGELAAKLSGVPSRTIESDGAPRAARRFVFWNPAPLAPHQPTRRSASVDATRLLTRLVEGRVPTLVFTKSRVVAELVYRYARSALSERTNGAGGLADAVSPYRGGYLPEERRAIEARLFSGELRAVVSTNALELGIDVGALDAVLLVGFPPTIASTWQQVGRAGRSGRESLAVVIAYEDPVDQYLIRHPEYFFGQSPESAILDQENATILRSQLACAAAELPVTDADLALFGERSAAILAEMEQDQLLALIRGRYFWAEADAPARGVSLRLISSDTITIVEAADRDRVLGTVDAISAPESVYPGAIYLHEGESYFVRALDLTAKIATVERRETDYYTQPVLDTTLRVRRQTASRASNGQELCVGDVTVQWVTAWFRKIRYHSLDSIGYGTLDLPPQTLETRAVWWPLPRAIGDRLRTSGHDPREALAGLRNVLITTLPLLAMCEPADIGGVLDSANTGSPALFIYDRFPGGLGYAERAFAEFGRLVRFARALVTECPCDRGCPSCVGLPILRPPIQQDPDLTGGWPIPSKAGTAALVAHLCAAWTEREGGSA